MVTVASNVTLAGAGSQSTTGGGDATVIVDDYAVNAKMLDLTIAATGTFRITGITFQGGTGALKDNGMVNFNGPGTLRIDHAHFNMPPYTDAGARGRQPFTIGDRVYGAIDHSILDLYANGAPFLNNGRGSDGMGNAAWEAPTAFGGADFFFIEDNIINGDISTTPSRAGDCFSAGRVVVRYNTLAYVSGVEDHATGHGGDDRGCRAKEVYGNHYTVKASQPTPAYDLHDMGSGTSLAWGNTADADALKNFFTFNVTRKDTTTYAEPITPTGWGYCSATLTTGTVDVAANGVTVTKTGGTNFNVSWPSGTTIDIVGASCSHAAQAPGAGTGCRVSSVSSTTSLTLQDTTGGALSGKTYTVGSEWDGNTDLVGYPCLDQVGRGQGQLLINFFSTKLNNVTGTRAWPNQALEPVYIWMNSGVPSPTGGGDYYATSGGAGRITSDRDYYAQASGIQTNATTPFNGTTGTGWGTLANRPTTCTVGVGYWATDAGGNWHTTNGTADDGELYVCKTLNTWGTSSDGWPYYYKPYTYPRF